MRSSIALVLFATIAHADPRDALERARELEAQLAYDEALAIIDAAIRAGQSDRERLVELHLIAGRLNAGLDRAKPAEDHFAIVLALRPETTLPEGTSPKIAVPFTRARTTTAPLDVQLLVGARGIGITASNALVVGIAARVRDGAAETLLVERTARRLSKTPSMQVLEVRALDAHGNVVWTGVPPAAPMRVVDERPHVAARWTTWAAVTGVAVAAGGVAAWRFRVAQDEFDDKRADGMTDFSALRAIEDRGDRWALAANISFGVAAATAITSVVLFARRPSPVVVTASGTTVGIAGSF